jgi:hypothetical protein
MVVMDLDLRASGLERGSDDVASKGAVDEECRVIVRLAFAMVWVMGTVLHDARPAL